VANRFQCSDYNNLGHHAVGVSFFFPLAIPTDTINMNILSEVHEIIIYYNGIYVYIVFSH